MGIRRENRNFEYINGAYKKEFKAGMKVLAYGKDGVLCYGTHYCHIRLKGEKFLRRYHPNDVIVVRVRSSVVETMG
jgi:hypothetical protein